MKSKQALLPGHTDGFHTIILDGKPEKVSLSSTDFEKISLWRQNVRASRDVLLNLSLDKENFLKELNKYPELKENAERLLKSILEYGVKDHIFCKETKNNTLVAYEGNSRSIALKLAFFKNPNLFSKLPVAIVPNHVSEKAVLDYVRHLHMDSSSSMRNWDRINKARDWESTISREGKKAANKLARLANQKAEKESIDDENYTPKSILVEVEAYRLYKLRAEKHGVAPEKWKEDPRSGSFSNHVSLVSKEQKIRGLFNKKSENFKKADYILERGTKSDTTGLSPQLLRKKAELLGKFSFSAIKKAADDQSLGKLFENQKRIKVKVKTTTTKTRTSISRNLLKAKGLIDNAIQQLRKAGLAVNKINEGKDYLKNIRAIINSFLEK